jgi:hypothetical protein
VELVATLVDLVAQAAALAALVQQEVLHQDKVSQEIMEHHQAQAVVVVQQRSAIKEPLIHSQVQVVMV